MEQSRWQWRLRRFQLHCEGQTRREGRVLMPPLGLTSPERLGGAALP
jgi:hypothetical protein|eukprot:COSAG01_NODE_403_length_17482_cov_77.249597_4_plen_47_part_00